MIQKKNDLGVADVSLLFALLMADPAKTFMDDHNLEVVDSFCYLGVPSLLVAEMV